MKVGKKFEKLLYIFLSKSLKFKVNRLLIEILEIKAH